MNPNNCKNTGIHEPIKLVNGSYQCRWCHKMVSEQGVLMPKLAKEFDKDEVYAKNVRYYMDKKGYTLEQANEVARKVVEREMARHTNSTIEQSSF